MRLLLLAFALTFAACSNDAPTVDPDSIADPVEPTIEQAAPTTKINLNTATDVEFKTVPGVGDRMAHEFDEYRPYASITQFRREMGKYVDADVIAGYEEYVFVPVDMNASDAATLAQLPGVDETEAQMLIDARPFGSQEQFMDALAPMMSDKERAGVATYLAVQ